MLRKETKIEIVKFNQQSLVCPLYLEEPYTIIDTIVENIGLNQKSALRNINSSRFGKHAIYIQVKQTLQNSENWDTIQYISFEKNGLKTEFLIKKSTHSVLLFEPIKGYKYVALPIRKIAGWLNSIDINKVKAEVRPILELYQEECDDVLYEHFFGIMAQRKKVLTRWNGSRTGYAGKISNPGLGLARCTLFKA